MYDTILVSDGGCKMTPDPEPHTDWARHALRINELIDNQVRSLRKRQVIGSYNAGERKGTYWGIRSDVADYPAPNARLPRCRRSRNIRRGLQSWLKLHSSV